MGDLTSLGLGPDATEVYAALLAAHSLTEEELVERVSLPETRVLELLTHLEEQAFASRRVDAPDAFVAVRPSVALGAALAARRREVRRAEEVVESLEELYTRTTRRAAPGEEVDLVVGVPSVRAHLLQLQASAREEVLSLVKAPVAALGSEANTAEDAAVSRGVKYRAVVETTMLEEEPRLRQAIGAARERGEEVRLARHVPIKLIVIDRAVALVPLGIGAAGADGALLVRGSGVLDALIALFDYVWASGFDVGPVEDPVEGGTPPLPDPHDLEILSLLMAGLTDQAVAKAVGTSTRTVQRRVRALMDHADASTRLQLGWASATRGWLPR